MKATALYRIASFLLLVTAAGNTYGLLRFWHLAGVVAPVRFPAGYSGISYAQVVFGALMFCSLCILFGAYLAWHLGGLARTTPRAIGSLGWMLFAYQLIGVCISWFFLAGFVRLLAFTTAVCIGWATGISKSAQRESAVNDQGQAFGTD